MQCPDCNQELIKKTVKKTEIDRCPSCSGLWLDKGELNKLVDDKTKMVEYNSVAYDSGLHGDKHPRRGCPHCKQPMQKVDLLEDTSLIYDYCPDCQGFWLDKGELEQTKTLLQQQKAEGTQSTDLILVNLALIIDKPYFF